MSTSKYRHNGLRDLGLGDAVMVSKERWRKHINELDLETFPKAWVGRGLREIHHENDAMDGRMDACLGFAAVMGCKIYKTISEMKEDLREEQKKCHNFHLFTYFLLSSKRPNTRSNHDMALSYLILSFHTSKSHHQDEESR